MCLSRNSVATHRNYSRKILNCVQFQIVSFLAEIPLHLIEISKLFPGRNSVASHRKFSTTIPNCVFAFHRRNSSTYFKDNSKFRNYSYTIPNCNYSQLHLIEIILRQFQIVSQPKFSCNSSKLFQENSKLCIGRKSVASHWSYSKTIPNRVLAEHLIEITLRQFQLCPGQISIASHWNYTKIIPNSFLADIPLHLIEKILRQFQLVS